MGMRFKKEKNVTVKQAKLLPHLNLNEYSCQQALRKGIEIHTECELALPCCYCNLSRSHAESGSMQIEEQTVLTTYHHIRDKYLPDMTIDH